MRDRFYDYFTVIKHELNANRRLRYGVWAIVIIVLLYLALIQSERVATAFKEYQRAYDREAKILAMHANQDGWFAATDTEKKNTEQLKQLLWQADTVGVAQALLQQSIEKAIAPLKMKNVRMRYGIATQVASDPAVWQVQIQVEARYSKGDEVQFLYNLESSPKQLIIDRLDLNQKSSQLMVQLSGYFTGLKDAS